MVMNLSKDIYPFSGKYLEINGLKYHYLDEGSGDPIVMLHGNPSWSIYYRNLVKELSSSYRCIVPDHIGCGFSDKPDDSRYEYTLDQRVSDLEALLKHLKINKNITLVVHDWGGMVGFTYATRFPETVARLVVLNTAAFHMPKSKIFPFPLWLGRNTKAGEFLILKYNAFSAAASHIGCKRNKMPKELREAYCAPYNSPENRIATLRFVQDIPLTEGDKAYKTVSEVQNKLPTLRNKPALICWGMKDFVFDKHFLHEWEKHLPAAKVVKFPDCGHYILEDATAEITEHIKEFLQLHPVEQKVL